MKRKMLKAAGCILSLVLTTCMFSNVNGYAAEQWNLQKKSKTLYLNADNSSNTSNTYDFNFVKLPENWRKLYNFKWTSKHPSIATVAKGGIVTAKSVGKTTIVCTVTSKEDGTVVATAQADVVVKENAAKVEILNKDLNETEVFEGTVLDLDRVLYNAAGERTTEQGVFVTDYTAWSAVRIENGKERVIKDEITIDQETGTFTMNKPGTYKLYVNVYQSSEYSQYREPFDFITVTVKEKDPFEVKQTELNKIELYLSKPVAKLSANTLTVQAVDNSCDLTIKEIVLNESGTVAELEFWEDMVHETTYSISWKKSYKEIYSKTWTASAGKPSTIELNCFGVQKDIVYISDTHIKNNKIDIVLRDETGIDVTTLYDIDSRHLTFLYDKKAAYNNGFSMLEDGNGFYLKATKTQKQLPLTALYYEYTDDGKKILLARCEKTLVSLYDPKTDISQKDIEAVGLYEERVEYDDIVQSKLKTKIAADDSTVQLVTMAQNDYGEKIEQDAFTYLLQGSEVAIVSPNGEFTPLKEGIAHIVVFYTNPHRPNTNPKSVYQLEVQITKDRHIAELSVSATSDQITGHVLAGESDVLQELDHMESIAVFYVTVLDSFGENCSEYAYNNNMITLNNPDIFQITEYDVRRKAVRIEVDGKSENVIRAITDDKNINKRQVQFATSVVATNEFGKRIKKDIEVLVKKPDSLAIKKYEIAAEAIDITEAMDNEFGTITLKMYGLNSKGIRVADVSNQLKYVKSLSEGEKLPIGSFFYTISKNGKVINADRIVSVSATHKVQVIGDRILDFVHTVSAKTSIGDVNVLIKEDETEYEIVLYQVTEQGTKKIQRTFIPVKNNLKNALSVKVLKTTTEWQVSDKNGWTTEADAITAIDDVYHFTFRGRVVKDLPINAQVTVRNGILQVKQMKVYVPVEDEYYLEYLVAVQAMITLEEQ